MFCGAAVDTQKHADAKQNVGGAWLIPTRSRAVKKVGPTFRPQAGTSPGRFEGRHYAPAQAGTFPGRPKGRHYVPGKAGTFPGHLITFAKATGVKKVGIA